MLIHRARDGGFGARNNGRSVFDNRATIGRENLAVWVVGGLKDRVMHPEFVKVFVEENYRAWNENQAGQVVQRAKTERDLPLGRKTLEADILREA